MDGRGRMKNNLVCCFCGKKIIKNEKLVTVSLVMEVATEEEPVEQVLFAHLSCIKNNLHKDVPLLLSALID